MQAAVDGRRGRARRGRRAGQQRRLQPERRDRDGADRGGARAVRDERLRPRAPVPARAAGDARAARAGKIVNVCSMGGEASCSPAAASTTRRKYAVEAISDALRFEVKGFGIDVILIEPGPDHDRVRRDGVGGVVGGGRRRRRLRAVQRARRRARPRASTRRAARSASLGGPPEAVAKVIEKALTAKRPRARYTVTPSAQAADRPSAPCCPTAAWDAVMRSQFPQPGK